MNDLFDACKARCTPELLESLIRANQDRVYNVCFQVLRHVQDAQDAAQQVLIHLLDDFPKISSAEHLRRWIYRASFQVALDAKKMRRRRREHEGNVRMAKASPEEAVDAIHAHVAGLDDELKALVAEHYFEKKPLSVLAQERGYSTFTAWQRLERAKKKLRESLTGAGFATLVPDMDGFLESIQPVPAPSGLMTRAVLGKAASVALTIGGSVVKIKLVAAVAVIALAVIGYGGYEAVRSRDDAPAEAKRSAASKAGRRATPAISSTTNVESTALPSAATGSSARYPSFPSAEAFWNAFDDCCSPDGRERWGALRRLGIALSDATFEQALGRVTSARETSRFQRELRMCILEAWRDTDPRGQVELMLSLPGPNAFSPVPETMMLWTERDAGAVASFVRSLPEGSDKSTLSNFLSALKDPERFANTLLTLGAGPGQERWGYLAVVARQWGEKDPERALEWVGRHLTGDPNVKVTIGGIGAEGTDWAEHERASITGSIASGWAKKDLRAALEWVDHLPETDLGKFSYAFPGVLKVCISKDPEAAAEFAAKVLRNGVSPMTITAALDRSMFHIPLGDVVQPSEMGRFVQALPAGPLRSDALRQLCQYWSVAEPQAARAWAEQLPEGDRLAALAELAAGWVISTKAGPQAALALASTLPDADRKKALSNVLSWWQEIDPAAVAATVATLPPGAVPSPAGLAARWAEKDPVAALEWSRRLPNEKERDEAVAQVALITADVDLRKGAALTTEVLDAVVRENTCLWIAWRRARKDPEGTKQWVTESTYSQEFKDKLAKAIEAAAINSPPTLR